MNKIMISCLVLLLAVAIILPSSHSVVPSLINYQGMVTDSLGVPLDGTHSITFRIYNNSAGGTQLWSEIHPSVDVNEGLFNVILGSEGSTLDQSIFAGTAAWLEIAVNGQTISTRTRFTTSAYSHRVTTVDGAEGGEINGSLVTSGAIKASGPIEPLGGIITPGGITIQSTGSNVVVIAGSSVITVSPSGGVTIQGSDVSITATDELTLSANNKVALDAPWVDLHSTDSIVVASDQNINARASLNLTAQAGFNLNLNSSSQINMSSGTQTNVNGGGILDLNGGIIQLN